MNKIIVFDFDGVVIDSTEVQKEALIGSYKLVVGDDNIPSFNQFFLHSGSSLKKIFTDMNLPLEMIEAYQEISSKNIHKIKIHNQMKQIIKKLISEGNKCALCTGKERMRTIELLEHLEIIDLFDIVVCSDDVKNCKPNPESMHMVMEKLGGQVEDYVMVGDANNDILCAKNANIFNIAVTWGEFNREQLTASGPDAIVDTPIQLYHAIHQIFDTVIPKKKYLVNDFVIGEDYCNMRCEYCLTKTSEFINDFKSQQTLDFSNLNYSVNSTLKGNMDNMSDIITTKYDVAILKVSGGEVLIVKNIIDFIKQESKRYKVVQLLTNGLLLNSEMLKTLSSLENLCIQISIDHHTVEGNAYRTNDKKFLNKILDNVECIVKYGIPLEINCVLTDKNTPLIKSFADYLLKYKGSNIMLFPFPVRGSQRDLYLPELSQLDDIRYIIDHYDQYQSIMAPKIYLKYLIAFLQSGKRAVRCSVAECTIGTFDTGVVTPCSNYWFKSLGNILGENLFSTLDKIGNDRIYPILSNSTSRLQPCKLCFTPWDILNLYMEGLITIDELCRSPLYSFSSIRSYILELKDTIMNNHNSKKL